MLLQHVFLLQLKLRRYHRNEVFICSTVNQQSGTGDDRAVGRFEFKPSYMSVVMTHKL